MAQSDTKETKIKSPPQPPLPPKSSQSFLKYFTVIAVLIASILPALYLAPYTTTLHTTTTWDLSPSINQFYHNFLIWITGGQSTEICNGNGIIGIHGQCVCELGWIGVDCSVAQPKSLNSDLDAGIGIWGRSTPRKQTLLFVTDSIGPLHSENDLSHLHEQIALQLQDNRDFDISILYTGQVNGVVDIYGEKLRRKGIRFETLPSTGLKVGKTEAEQTSYEVYQHLRSSTQHYDVIQFTSSSASGYFTMNSRRQGLMCMKSRIVILLDKFTQTLEEKIARENPEYIPTEAGILKQDFMQQKMVEWADTVILPSDDMLQFAIENGWQLPADTRIVKYMSSVKSPKRVNSKPWKSKAKEFLFVGPLSEMRGLTIFADALDYLAEWSVKKDLPNFKVRFAGEISTVKGISSDDYLQLRSTQWNQLDWTLDTDTDWNETLTYARTPKSGRVIISPSTLEYSGFYFQEAVYAGVPAIASNLKAFAEVIHPQDRGHILFPSNNSFALAKKMEALLLNGTTVSRPSIDAPAVFQQWLDVYGPNNETPNSCSSEMEGREEEEPLVSVVVVHRNRHHLLKQSIESIEQQTYKNIEVILVDDGSTDADSIAYLNELAWKWWETKGWRVLRKSNRYLGAARNTGVENARGKYVLFLDDDDYAKPHQIATYVKVAQNTNADVVTSGHDLFSGNEVPGNQLFNTRFLPLGDARLAGMLENVFGDANMFINRDFFVDIGGFTEDFGVGFEDYEFLAKVVLKGHHLEAIPEALQYYRVHSNSMSSQTDLKTNQARFLRPYMEASPTFDKVEQDLLKHTQKRFFERDYPTLEFELDLTNSTIPTDPENTCTQNGLIYVSECNRCYVVRPNLDCAGHCPEDYSYGWHQDCTGRCLAPNEKPAIMDACGVCKGDNSSCKDCCGDVNGQAVVDYCGVCKGKGDTCFGLGSLSPNFIANTGDNVIDLLGSGFDSSIIVFVDGLPITEVDLIPYYGRTDKVAIRITRIFDLEGKNSITVPVYVRNKYQQTTSVMLTIYEANAKITDMSPEKVYVGPQSTTITFQGIHFISSPTAMCIFHALSYNNKTTAPVTFIDENTITCKAPEIYESQVVNVAVVFGGRDESVFYLPANVTMILHYFEAAPKPVRVVFAPNGAFIEMKFDKPTNGFWTSLPCNNYFISTDEPSVAMIQDLDETDCLAEFVAPDRMIISIKGTFAAAQPTRAPAPDLYLIFKPGVLRTQYAMFSDSTMGRTRISAPLNPISPTVLVSMPYEIGPCANITVDLSKSSGSAGRPFQSAAFTFEDLDATSYSPNIELYDHLTESAVTLIDTQTMTFTIPGYFLTFNHRYKFRFQLNNFLGGSGFVFTTIIRRSNSDPPYIYVDAPLTISPSKILRMDAVIDPSRTCNQHTMTNLRWSHVSGGPRTITLSSTTNVVSIPAYTLEVACSYRFRFSVTLGTLTYYTDRIVTTEYGVLSAAIRGGNRAVGNANPFTLEAEIFDDTFTEAETTRRAAEYSYEWQCFTSTGAICWNLKTKSKLYLGNARTITIPKETLAPNTIYVLNVQVRHSISGRSSISAPIRIDMREGRIPTVMMTVPFLLPTPESETFYLNAAVDPTSISGPVQYEWSAPEECGNGYYFGINLTRSMTETELDGPRLKFKPWILLAGKIYCFRVDVSYPDNPQLRGYATQIVRVKSRPSIGYCEVLGNNTGEAWSTVFTVQCTAWTPDPTSGQLLFNWYHVPQNDTSNNWTPMKLADSASTFSTVMGPGNHSIVVEVMDDYGSRSDPVFLPIIVNTNTSTSVSDVWESMELEFDASSNLAQQLQQISVIVNYLSEPDDGIIQLRRLHKREMDPETIRARIIEVLHFASSNMLIDPIQVGPLLIALFNSTLVSGMVPLSREPLVMDSLHSISSGVVENTIKDCLLNADTTLLVNVLGTVLSSTANTTLTKTAETILNHIDDCVAINQICDQDPYISNTNRMNVSVGIADRTTYSTTPLVPCDTFTIPNLGSGIQTTSSTSQCIRYRCSKSNMNYLSKSSSRFNLLDDKVYSMVLKDESGQNSIPLAQNVTFSLALSASTVAQLNTSVILQNSGRCTYFDRNLNMFTDEGCTATGFNKTHLSCSCNHLTEFAAAFGDANSYLQTEVVNTSLIAALVVLSSGASIIVAVYAILRSRKKKKERLDKAKVGLEDEAITESKQSIAPISPYVLSERDRVSQLMRLLYWQQLDETSPMIDVDGDIVPRFAQEVKETKNLTRVLLDTELLGETDADGTDAQKQKSSMNKDKSRQKGKKVRIASTISTHTAPLERRRSVIEENDEDLVHNAELSMVLTAMDLELEATEEEDRVRKEKEFQYKNRKKKVFGIHAKEIEMKAALVEEKRNLEIENRNRAALARQQEENEEQEAKVVTELDTQIGGPTLAELLSAQEIPGFTSNSLFDNINATVPNNDVDPDQSHQQLHLAATSVVSTLGAVLESLDRSNSVSRGDVDSSSNQNNKRK